MKKSFIIQVVTMFLAITLSTAYAYEAINGPTEVIYFDKSKAYNGYTLFSPRPVSFTYLIDMEGNVINTWQAMENPRLLENEHLFGNSRKDSYKGLTELDWDSNVVWEYYEKRRGYNPHHDHMRIFNKKLKAYTNLYIANVSLTHEQCIAAGCDPNAVKSYDRSQMDAIVEVDMDGNIVWEWWFFDHVVQDIDPTKANYGAIATNPGKINLNYGRAVQRDWLHLNAMDYNEELDLIVTDANRMHELYVIDHGNTFIPGDSKGSIKLAASSKGDFLYRFGNPAIYNQGEFPSVLKDPYYISTGTMQMGGNHNVQWIRPGLPGAGNFLIFNNGTRVYMETPQSSVLEINPYLDINKKNTGHYVNPPDAGYYWTEGIKKGSGKPRRKISNQIVWSYETKSDQSFTSLMMGSVQRLPNGNTLVCSSSWGHLFEVTYEGEVVWEYIIPVTEDGILKTIGDTGPMYNAAFRCYRYGPDYPGLKGKDLTPKGKITESASEGKIEQFNAQKGRKAKGKKGKGRDQKGGQKASSYGKRQPQGDEPKEDAFLPY
ncbi:MAG: aryl-sulfate sulfotransferase [Deltaproteobacteria bacterium]|nr:aryl-sulfate sulfotransferase [Deltaproteobacteria bacterium]MBW1913531.1 aryl-sulfate sulfotransferase [Deltaproteobacteria bacterium]